MEWLSWILLLVIQSQLLYHSSLPISLSSSLAIVGPKCHPEERAALLQFKRSFTINTSDSERCASLYQAPIIWDTSASNCCAWSAIRCDEETGHVISLNLFCSGLHGTITSNSSLFLLRQLQLLDLSYNDFRGSLISPEFGQFKNMTYLTLRYSNFSGYVPLEISHLSCLVSFRLLQSITQFGSNALYMEAGTFKGLARNLTNLRLLQIFGVDMSSVPLVSFMNLSSSITFISLDFCNLSGELPENIFLLPKLQSLSLYGNNLTGSLPKSNWSSLLGSLDLSSNSFSGHIPRSLFNLEQLTRLDLSFNNFEGRIPDFFTNATQDVYSYDLSKSPISSSHLKLSSLSLSDNLLNGTIPPCVFSLPYLSILDLSNNFFSGEIGRISLWERGNDSLLSLNLSHNFLTKVELLPRVRLTYLDLRSNLLLGPLPSLLSPFLNVFLAAKNQFRGEIPASICNMTSLQILDLSYNNLSGGIPRCMEMEFLSLLSVLDLRGNRLHGIIPRICTNQNSMRNLNLNGNQLRGPLPRSLAYCKSLEVLDLGNNMLNDTFPHWLETLPELRVLVLRSNRFHGSIGTPNTRFPFRELKIIDISHNKFSGALPIEYFENFKAMMNGERVKMGYMGEYYYQDSMMMTIKGFYIELVKIQTILTTIDFSNNNFTGEIPELIGMLKSLKGLNFSHNMLRGTIPLTLRNLTNLEWLDLSSNQLVGKIPVQLVDLTFLAILNLSHNQFKGQIPRGNQFNTFDYSSFSGNLGLCGFQLSKTCEEDTDIVKQTPPPASLEQAGDSSYVVFDWKIVLMGYGCGLVIGISMGYVLLYSDGKLSWICERILGELQCSRVRRPKKRKANLAW